MPAGPRRKAAIDDSVVCLWKRGVVNDGGKDRVERSTASPSRVNGGSKIAIPLRTSADAYFYERQSSGQTTRILTRQDPSGRITQQRYARHVVRCVDPHQVEECRGNRKQWYLFRMHLRGARRLANPEYSIWMVHPALSSLQSIEQIKEGDTLVGILNTKRDILG